jgi:hypothetical protein
VKTKVESTLGVNWTQSRRARQDRGLTLQPSKVVEEPDDVGDVDPDAVHAVERPSSNKQLSTRTEPFMRAIG